MAHWLTTIGFAVVLGAPVAWAQQPPPMRIRGTIERVDGSVYVIKARDGAELKLPLGDKPQIAGVAKASLSDIKQGSFVGVTAMPQADGTQRALEVHIFPESMRGTGEGHYPWDLNPQSTMTNANVEQIAASAENLKLDELVSKNVQEFAFIMTPLKIRGATGSTVSPIAVR
jgi:hypothetical protein